MQPNHSPTNHSPEIPENKIETGVHQLSLGSEFDVLHKVNPYALQEMSPIYQAAHKRALEIVEGNRIHLDDFPHYKDLEKDKQAVIIKIKEINSGTQKEGVAEAIIQAEILEAMVFDLVKNFKIFGDKVSAILPSNYDDLFLGNDLILSEQIGSAKAYSGVGIDITLGEQALMNKFQATKRRLEKGHLGKVKYFKSENGKELNDIPHFVIGVDREHLFKITSLWVQGKIKEIKDLKVAENFIKMMITQCDEFIKIPKENVKEVYSEEKVRLLAMLERIK